MIRRNIYQQVSEFYRGKIVACRQCGLPFHHIAHRSSQDIFTLIRIWINWLLSVILNGIQGLDAAPSPVSPAKLYNHIMDFLSGNGNFYAPLVSACTLNLRLQQFCLPAGRPLYWLPLTMQHCERRNLWCKKWQSSTQHFHKVVFSEETQFCMQYSVARICIWRL